MTGDVGVVEAGGEGGSGNVVFGGAVIKSWFVARELKLAILPRPISASQINVATLSNNHTSCFLCELRAQHLDDFSPETSRPGIFQASLQTRALPAPPRGHLRALAATLRISATQPQLLSTNNGPNSAAAPRQRALRQVRGFQAWQAAGDHQKAGGSQEPDQQGLDRRPRLRPLRRPHIRASAPVLLNYGEVEFRYVRHSLPSASTGKVGEKRSLRH